MEETEFTLSELAEVDRSSDKYKLLEELFVIPDEDGYILYAPLKKSVLLVNKAAVRALQEFKEGREAAISRGSDIHERLVKAGILVLERDSDRQIAFEKQDGEFDPSGVSLFLTTRCSMRCIYCYSKGGDSSKIMPWKTAKTAIDWIIDHTSRKGRNRFYVNFHGGGEVTMAMPLMKKCVEYARRQANSNGLTASIEAGLNGVMSVGTADWIIHNLDGATVSLDGLPDIQNAQRPMSNGNTSFERVCATLHHMDAGKFNYGIRATITQESVDQLVESVKFLSRTFAAAGGIQVEPFFQAGRAKANRLPAVDPAAFVEKYRKAAKVAADYGKQLKYSGARFGTITNCFCKATGNSFAVTPEAQVTSCYEVTDLEDTRAPLFFFGSLDERSGKFRFDQETMNTLRSLTVENKGYCKDCFCKWHCAGDCPAKLALNGNAWDSSANPRCYINQELTKDQIKLALNSGNLHELSVEY